MFYREIIAVCSQIHTKHINTLCGQNVEFPNVKPGGVHTKGKGQNRHRRGEGVNSTRSEPGTGRKWAVSSTLQSLHPFERLGISCSEKWCVCMCIFVYTYIHIYIYIYIYTHTHTHTHTHTQCYS